MSQSLSQPFLPPGEPIVDLTTGALTPAGSRFLRSLWARTGSASGSIPLPSDVATQTYVDTHIAAAVTDLAPEASPTFTGTPRAPTAPAGTATTQIATTAFVDDGYAPLASPTFTGTPKAPTAAPGTSTTQLATTAFVEAAVLAVEQGIENLGTIAAGASGTGTVTFATPFVTAPEIVLVSSSSADLTVGADPANITTTGFDYDWTSHASASAAYSMCWLAR